jgi:hypothetical protein
MYEVRRLQLHNKPVVKRYQKLALKYLTQENVFARQYLLETEIIPGVPLNPRQARCAEKIDEDRTRCLLKAEKKCRKKRMGAVQFSLATEQPR